MRKVYLLQSTASTGSQHLDKLLNLLKERPQNTARSLIAAMGFKSVLPLDSCLKALEQKGAIRMSPQSAI